SGLSCLGPLEQFTVLNWTSDSDFRCCLTRTEFELFISGTDCLPCMACCPVTTEELDEDVDETDCDMELLVDELAMFCADSTSGFDS
ncbi:hypothetical protein BpHYR1_029959, partial [Brachionus plicatilis]